MRERLVADVRTRKRDTAHPPLRLDVRAPSGCSVYATVATHGRLRSLLARKIRDIPGLPEPGIVFRDITPLLQDPKSLELAYTLLAEPYLERQVDLVVGIESRGFLFGPAVAQQLGAGSASTRSRTSSMLTFRTSANSKCARGKLASKLSLASKWGRLVAPISAWWRALRFRSGAR